jgi:uncharacterized protein YbjT (DUF2867 family)
MRIAVIGGTGVAGRHTVEALRRAGHDTIVVARSRGVDIATGEGLDDALVGVDTVIDVTNIQAPDAEATRNLFAAATRNLLAAEQHARVRHHVLLSIVGIDRLDGNAHLAGKRQQEAASLQQSGSGYDPTRHPVPRVRWDGGRVDTTRRCCHRASAASPAGCGRRRR